MCKWQKKIANQHTSFNATMSTGAVVSRATINHSIICRFCAIHLITLSIVLPRHQPLLSPSLPITNTWHPCRNANWLASTGLKSYSAVATTSRYGHDSDWFRLYGYRCNMKWLFCRTLENQWWFTCWPLSSWAGRIIVHTPQSSRQDRCARKTIPARRLFWNDVASTNSTVCCRSRFFGWFSCVWWCVRPSWRMRKKCLLAPG